MKILVCGSNGRMGNLVVNAASAYDCEVVATINSGSDFDTEFRKDPDLCIDFSSPDGLLKLVEHAAEKKIKVISGTTGLKEEHWAVLKKYSGKIPILYSTNFSIGIYVLNKLVKVAADLLPDSFDIELIERHHSAKKDAPSGTAMSLLDIIQSTFQHKTLFGRHGEAPRIKGEICVHSVRGGDIVGEHEVMFAGIGERLELVHRATDRGIFARGALYAANIFAKIDTPGIYALSDIL